MVCKVEGGGGVRRYHRRYDIDYGNVFCSLHTEYFTVSVIPKEGLAGLVPYFWYDNKKDFKVSFYVTLPRYYYILVLSHQMAFS